MSTSLVRILIVGPRTAGTDGVVKKLTGAGWGSQAVATVGEAETVLKTIRFKVVLSAEKTAGRNRVRAGTADWAAGGDAFSVGDVSLVASG